MLPTMNHFEKLVISVELGECRNSPALPEGQYTQRNLTLQKVARIGILLGSGIILSSLVLVTASVATPLATVLLTSIGLVVLATAKIWRHFLKIIDKKGASSTQHESYSHLFKAVAENDKFKVEFLLACGANPNTTSEGLNVGDTPLHIAARKGYADLLVQLIKAGANRNMQNAHQWTPLHEAVFHEQEQCVKFLAYSGANLKIKGRLEKNNQYSTLVTPLELAGNLVTRTSIDDRNYNTRNHIFKMVESSTQ